ncbi:MAG: acyl-CoA carboxylase subunit beta [Proteobacteria bacterium]|nr:acyl-CoA carboxylase subunit beta [Pseudomonadota bacterium]
MTIKNHDNLAQWKTLEEKLLKGGSEKYHEQNAKVGKQFARERIKKLIDSNSFIEEGLYANCQEEGLPSDGVITGFAKVNGRSVGILANDSTVKAGSWGKHTVEKMIRLQEQAAKLAIPIYYLIDSAGARITDQVEMFPGRRGAGKIFNLQCRLSGYVPQICLLFGPSAAGGAYIPAFCDVVIMVKNNASMYLGSPRMAESVIGERVTLEQMGGAQMHCSVSGVGDILAENEDEAIKLGKDYLNYFPQNFQEAQKLQAPLSPLNPLEIEKILPENPAAPYDMKKVIEGLVDLGSFFEMKKLFAQELITGFARIKGRVIGIVANQPRIKGGVIFVDSADKAARFVFLCDAFNIPLLFLSDVPGFMIGSQVEKMGIIRHGAKMVFSISEATVPKICVVVRKAFGAGLYAMCGPGFDPDCTLALPTGQIAVMGPDPAVNAVYYNKIQEITDIELRKKFVEEKKAEYEKDVDLKKLASELVIDQVVQPEKLRDELAARFDIYSAKDLKYFPRKHGVVPV